MTGGQDKGKRRMTKTAFACGEMTHGRCQRREWALPARAKEPFAYPQMRTIDYRQIKTMLQADDVPGRQKPTTLEATQRVISLRK